MNPHFHQLNRLSLLALSIVLVACCFEVHSSLAQTRTSPPLPSQFMVPPLSEIPAAQTHVPLSADQKAAIDKALAFWEQARICKIPIDLKMTDATLDDVVARVKQEPVAKNLSIEVRDATATRLSFDLKRTKIGNILDIVAGLAGSKLYLQGSGLLISAESKLSAAELQGMKERKSGQWIKSNDGGTGQWNTWGPVSQVLFQAIAVDVTGKPIDQLPTGVIHTTFDHFSPQSQQFLRTYADFLTENTRLAFPGTAPVTLNYASPVTVKIYAPDRLDVSLAPDPRPADVPALPQP